MGIDATLFAELCGLAARFRPEGRSLMLGRQRFAIEAPYAKSYEAALRAAGIRKRRFDLLQDDGFAEALFAGLGLGAVETMDMTAAEMPDGTPEGQGAHVQDLNEPVPGALHGAFDLIFDGGTIEHVFDTRAALENVFAMLAPGGRFVSANGMNGWAGHGMYQFSPELVWSFWKRRAGCEVVRCAGLRKIPGAEPLDFPDPAEAGRRLRLKGRMPEGRVYLYYEVRKPAGARLAGAVQQSDYAARWARADAGAMTGGT